MSKLIQKRDNQQDIFKIIFERDTKRILESIMDSPKSANQIIFECNIAQSTAYRKLKRLLGLNIVRVKYVMAGCGRWEMQYQSNLCLFRDTPVN